MGRPARPVFFHGRWTMSGSRFQGALRHRRYLETTVIEGCKEMKGPMVQSMREGIGPGCTGMLPERG